MFRGPENVQNHLLWTSLCIFRSGQPLGPGIQYNCYPFSGFWESIYVYKGSYRHHCLCTDPPVQFLLTDSPFSHLPSQTSLVSSHELNRECLKSTRYHNLV